MNNGHQRLYRPVCLRNTPAAQKVKLHCNVQSFRSSSQNRAGVPRAFEEQEDLERDSTNMTNISAPVQEYWLPGYELSRQIVLRQIQYFLGPSATIRPYSLQVQAPADDTGSF